MNNRLECSAKIFLLTGESRYRHYRRVFKKLADAYAAHLNTQLIGKRLSTISDKDIFDLIVAEIDDFFSHGKRWHDGEHRHENLLLKIYPEIALTMIKDDEKFCPFAEDYVVVSEETEFSSRVDDVLIDIASKYDHPWCVWEVKTVNNHGDFELKCLGDYRILEWTRLVNEGSIPFKDSVTADKQFLDPETMEINEACAKDLLTYRKKGNELLGNMLAKGWGMVRPC